MCWHYSRIAILGVSGCTMLSIMGNALTAQLVVKLSLYSYKGV